MHDDGEARAAEWLAAWDAQGIHRTATVGDEGGADWLMREAAALGVVAASEEWGLDRLDPVAAYLEIDGVPIEGVPVFDAPATDPDGVTGALGPIGGQAAIAVAELSPHIVYAPDYRRLRNGDHRGLVIVCQGAQPGLGLLNAEQFRHPYGAPAIQIPSEAREMVLAAAGRGAPARLVVASRRIPARGRNVVNHGRRPGPDTDAARGDDPSQLMVAIYRRARRRARVLARNLACANRQSARLRGGFYRQ